jgi:hypothetical protein
MKYEMNEIQSDAATSMLEPAFQIQGGLDGLLPEASPRVPRDPFHQR